MPHPVSGYPRAISLSFIIILTLSRTPRSPFRYRRSFSVSRPMIRPGSGVSGTFQERRKLQNIRRLFFKSVSTMNTIAGDLAKLSDRTRKNASFTTFPDQDDYGHTGPSTLLSVSNNVYSFLPSLSPPLFFYPSLFFFFFGVYVVILRLTAAFPPPPPRRPLFYTYFPNDNSIR